MDLSLDVISGSDLFQTQCKQLIAFLTSKLQPLLADATAQSHASVSNFTGIVSSIIDPISSIDNSWLLDSGATHHVCYNHSLFHSFNPVLISLVTLPTRSIIPIEFIGFIFLFNNLLLENVLFIPTFKFNLISFSAFLNQVSISVTFNRDHCIL